MTILVQQQLRNAAGEIANWSGSLTDTWVSPQANYIWIVGCIDEEDQKYPVVRIEADAYGHQGESEKLAEFLRLANPKAVLALLDELDQLKTENAELKAQAGKSVGPLTLGIRGKAYDPPGTHRAYTYAEQPDNLGAWRLGEALVEAYRAPAGDHIDGGLGLLKSLQLRGFGVFEMDRAMTKEQP